MQKKLVTANELTVNYNYCKHKTDITFEFRYLVSVGSILTLSKSSYLTLLVSRDLMASLTGGKVTNYKLTFHYLLVVASYQLYNSNPINHFQVPFYLSLFHNKPVLVHPTFHMEIILTCKTRNEQGKLGPKKY